jgi:hypothetical protein
VRAPFGCGPAEERLAVHQAEQGKEDAGDHATIVGRAPGRLASDRWPEMSTELAGAVRRQLVLIR